MCELPRRVEMSQVLPRRIALRGMGAPHSQGTPNPHAPLGLGKASQFTGETSCA
jgi:hypothetical protein